jgi:hypothetical protein
MEKVLFQTLEKAVYVDDKLVENKKGIVNNSTKEVIGIVGKNYKVVNNRTILNHFGEIADSLKLKWELADGWLIRGGAKTIMRIDFPDLEMAARKGDIVKFNATLTNGFNGFSSARLEMGFFRLVCTNGAIIGTKDYVVGYKHVGNVNEKIIEGFRAYLNDAVKKGREFITDLSKKNFLEPADVKILFDESDWIGDKQKENLKLEWKKQGAPLNAWLVFNVYTYIITHLMKINQENRNSKLKALYYRSLDWRVE